MFRLRTLLLLILVGLGVWFAGPTLLKGYATAQINKSFAKIGFPSPSYTFEHFSFTALALTDIQMEPEGISTISRIEAEYTPLGLIFGRLHNIRVIDPDFIYSSDDPPIAKDSAGFNLDHLFAFSLHDIPADSLSIENLGISYASDVFNPSVNGSLSLLTGENDNRTLTLALKSEQKDLAVTLNGTLNESQDGRKELTVDIPTARFDIPDIARLSRANAKFTIISGPNTPPAIKGELAAGALKIGTLPLDGITIVASGSKPDLSIIGNAAITGVPQAGLSLRLTEDAKGARLLLQLSGETPKALIDTLLLDNTIPLPAQQKFALAFDSARDSLAALLTAPYQGNLFLYGDTQTPILGASMTCTSLALDCVLKLPRTKLAATQIDSIAGPWLADHGLVLKSGDIQLGGELKTAPATNGKRTATLTAEAITDTLAADWRNVPFSTISFSAARNSAGILSLRDLRAATSGGTLAAKQLDIDAAGNGKTALTLANINLAELAKAVPIGGLDISGTLTGTLPLLFRNGSIIADKGANLTGSTGILRYHPDSYPAFLQGDDNRMRLLREALSNYTFDSLAMTFTGDLNGELSATLAAKGRNTTLSADRPIHINLNISGPLAPALRRLLPTISTAPATPVNEATP